MVKYFLLFILVPLHCIAQAQNTFPAGVANTYTLGEKDGYNGFIYTTIDFGKDGTFYTCDFAGNIEIHGNNYSFKMEGITNEGIILKFKIINSDEVWAIGLKSVVIIKNNKVERKIPYPKNVINVVENTNGFYLFCANNNTVETYIFEGEKIELQAASDIPVEINNGGIYESANHDIWLSDRINDTIKIYKLNKETGVFNLKKADNKILWIGSILDENNIYYRDVKNKGIRVKEGKIIKLPYGINTGMDNCLNFYSGGANTDVLYKYEGAKYYTATLDTNFNVTYETPFLCDDDIPGTFKNSTAHFNIGLTGNKPFLISNYIKKYPTLFDHANASSVFSLKEDSIGRIWAGSYKNKIAIISNGQIITSKNTAHKIMNGGSFFNNHMYLIGEGDGGLLQFDMQGNAKPLHTDGTGFYTYISKNAKHFYYSTINHLGLWQTTTRSLETLQPVWNKIDSTKGNTINNILTIAEDTLGRIWCGHPRNGIAVYDPVTDKATSWSLDKKETPFGGFSSLTDNKGTVWIGGRNGLWFYNNYDKAASPQNCIKLNHPLINTATNITALTIYKRWLVIAAYDKVLLFDLKSFYENQKLVVRYLNPYEANFTSFTEQNTMFTAKDSTIWFSTGDMLYNWDIKNWLSLETPKVKTILMAVGNGISDTLLANKVTRFEPSNNSFNLVLHYVSTDNMLRYTSTAFIREGDTITMSAPSLEKNFEFKNLQSGHYTLYVDIFEMDGTTSHYEYKITIKKFLWQQWWFWAIISLMLIGVSAWLINLSRKRQLAEQKAKTKEAELQSFKSEQEKKLANLRLVTLSSQFRPHFILNALNTIGAQMDDKPEAESVLSRLGESVNLIFNHAKQQKTLHAFESEWKLVTNIIHIHRLMYLKQLETILPDEKTIESIKTVQLPMGLLQIPVENALLHGLSNREGGPWKLVIQIQRREKDILVTITDNGVGRKKSAILSNHTKHGTGTKNQEEIIGIINNVNTEKIIIEYQDGVFGEDAERYGTTAQIIIPNNLHYEG